MAPYVPVCVRLPSLRFMFLGAKCILCSSSLFSSVAGQHSFVYQAVLLLAEIWTVPHFGLLQTKLLGIFLYKTIGCILEIHVCISLGLNYQKLRDHSPRVHSALYQIFPQSGSTILYTYQEGMRVLLFQDFAKTFGVVSLLNIGHSGEYAVVSRYGLIGILLRTV